MPQQREEKMAGEYRNDDGGARMRGHRGVTLACVNERFAESLEELTMRVAIVSVAVLAGIGALAFVGLRLAGTFGQVGAMVRVQPVRADVSAARADGDSAPRGETVERVAGEHDLAVRDRNAAAASVGDAVPRDAPAAASPNGGDEHILRMLAADPELARAADELLDDPDPRARQEAEQLLRDLGVLERDGRP